MVSVQWHKPFISCLSRAIGNTLHSFTLEDGLLRIRLFSKLSKAEVRNVRDIAYEMLPRHTFKHNGKFGYIEIQKTHQ